MFPLNIANFNEIFSSPFLLVFIIFSVLNGVLLFFASLKFLLSMQQGGYNAKRYFKWLINPLTPYLSRLMILCLMGFLFSSVLSMTFTSVLGKEIASFIGVIPYLLFTALYIKSESEVNAKVPLKKTKRLVRLFITFIISLSLLTFGLIVLLNFIAFSVGNEVVCILRYSLLSVLPILCPFVLFIAYLINEPLEEIIKRYYLKKAKIKLEKSDIIKIGITGSFGKTTVKEILKTLLGIKFRVLATPESYNTPLGISITLKNLDSTHDVFIAEMGARNKGDVKELSKLVNPKYGVITGINSQHLESFKTIENIKDTKFELMESLPTDGVGFFSSDNEGGISLFERFKGNKVLAGLNSENALVTASNVLTDKNGTEFTLNIKGEKSVKCSTVLLGKHSISNILLAVSIAYKLGLTVEEIAKGIGNLKSVGHRLQLIPNNKGVVIIDDSYNSSEDGVKAAMETLDLFNGRKIVLTPGLIELGKRENVANLNFARLLSKSADMVIVIGRHNAEVLIQGLLDEGMKKENVFFCKNLKKGNEYLSSILREGDVVLFENDLPDNYN